MLREEDVSRVVIAVIASQMNIERSEVEMGQDLCMDLGIDSLDKTEILAEIEDKLSVDIPYECGYSFREVGQIVDYVFDYIVHNNRSSVPA